MKNMLYNQLFPGTSTTKIEEDPDKVVLKVAAWGYTRDDLEIKIEDDFLIVREKSNTESSFCAHLNERFKLTRGIRRKGVKAKLENGVLQIELQKGFDGKGIQIEIE